MKWQIPVSTQDARGKEIGHLFTEYGGKETLVKALCGRLFNPGYAVPYKPEVPRCTRCYANWLKKLNAKT